MPISTSPRVRIRVSAQPPPSNGLPSAPSWVMALTVGRFAQVATGNTIASLDPKNVLALNPDGGSAPWTGQSDQKAVITGYGGGWLAANIGARGVYGVWNGGHKDYYGNEVYGLDLGTRLWARYTDPYPTPGDALHAVTGWHPAHSNQINGSPGVPHTYSHVQYVPSMKCVVTPRVQKDNAGGGSSTPAKVGIFPMPGAAFTQYVWQEGSAFPAGGSAPVLQDGWGCFDSNRNRIISHGGSGSSSSLLVSIDPTTGGVQGAYGTWTSYGNKISTSGTGVDFDPVNDCIVNYSPDGRLRGIDAANLGGTVTTLAQTPPPGLSAPPVLGKGLSVAYSDALRGFLVWDGGGTVYLVKMNAGAGTWKTNGWTWSMISTDTAVGPVRGTNGSYNRFRIMRYADAEVALVIMGVTENLWAFRTA